MTHARNRDLARIEQGEFAALIIGGGIVGASIARDAAMRGVPVLLVEARDFASGTSSRSTRLLHGGLRYLEQGHLKLVHEAATEKMTLHRIAPHISAPLPFLFPTFAGGRRPRWLLSAGVKIYDLLAEGRNLGPSSTLSRSKMTEKVPGLVTNGLTGGVRYFDAFTNDARLVLDTLGSAAQKAAVVLNYVSFLGAERTAGQWQCRVADRPTGREFRIRTPVVVNAAGAWADTIPYSSVRLRLTKGIHLVVDQERFPVPEAVVLCQGQRILFAIPWGRRVILGTTDTHFSGDPAMVAADAADVNYVIDVINAAFPKARLTTDDIIADWAGVRPLLASRHDTEAAPSNISRSHTLRSPHPGWLDVAGGKLTTSRLMAEQALDWIGQYLHMRLPPCRTAIEPIPPATGEPALSGLLPPVLGSDSIRRLCRDEWVTHLDDLLLRRTSWHYYYRDREPIIQETSQVLAGALGWTAARCEQERQRYQAATRSFYSTCLA